MRRIVVSVMLALAFATHSIAAEQAVLIEKHESVGASASAAIGTAKYCFEGTVWVRFSHGNYVWGGQQLDKNGKPITCGPVRSK